MALLCFSHLAFSCDDPIAVERFYTKHFGFRRARVYSPGPDQVVQIERGPVAIELFRATEARPCPTVGGAGPAYRGYRHMAFLVDDLDAKIAAMGPDARITLGPVDMSQFIPGMRVAWIADPEGNIIELNQGYVNEDSPPPPPA